jgi:hypothetical protein
MTGSTDTVSAWVRDSLAPTLLLSVTKAEGVMREGEVRDWLRRVARSEGLHLRACWVQDARHAHIFVGGVERDVDPQAFRWQGFNRVEPIRSLEGAVRYALGHVDHKGAHLDVDVACDRRACCRHSGGCRVAHGPTGSHRGRSER